MPYFLDKCAGGMTKRQFFDWAGLDAIYWTVPHRPDAAKGEFYEPDQPPPDFLESRRISSPDWQVHLEEMPNQPYHTIRYVFVTPKGHLTMVLAGDVTTSWVIEPLVKEKHDIDLIGEFVTAPKCDVEAVNRDAAAFGERGLVRGHICAFDVFGQPGTWQDACCIVGTEKMIMATYDDPAWVHELLGILMRRKISFLESMVGANYDLLELGGGSASTTVISPRLFESFVAPYDTQVIAAAHRSGQRVVYHTCGGMMPILEQIAGMGPDAMETFTPRDMGGDVDLAEAKRRIGDRVCMIGGFDQFHFLQDCTPEATRAEVRRCFQAAGAGGGYLISPSDHFFDADPELVRVFADEASRCTY